MFNNKDFIVFSDILPFTQLLASTLSRPLTLTVLLAASAAGMPSAWGATLAVCKKSCAFQTIQTAINASQSGDTITIGAGTYFENLVIAGKTLNILGAGEDFTAIDGNFAGPVVQTKPISQVATNITLQAVTILHGFPGIFVNSASLNLKNSAVLSNRSDQLAIGGGIYALGSYVTIDTSIITHNQTLGVGGAIALLNQSNCVVTNSTLSRNTASVGGAMYVDSQSIASISGSTLSDNTANGINSGPLNSDGEGGAVYVDQGRREPSGELTISGSYLVNNKAAYDGGAIWGPGTLSNSVVAGNTSGHFGGGLYGITAAQNVFVVQNHAATDGGGLYNVYESLSLTGSTIIDNSPDNCDNGTSCPAP